jgi:hypothetical protein
LSATLGRIKNTQVVLTTPSGEAKVHLAAHPRWMIRLPGLRPDRPTTRRRDEALLTGCSNPVNDPQGYYEHRHGEVGSIFLARSLGDCTNATRWSSPATEEIAMEDK